MLRVSLLGEQVIVDEATGVVRSGSSRAVELIEFLVVHAGAPQSRQRIAGLIWPDSSGAQALTNLRRELHQLRQVLGDELSLVVTSRDLTWRDAQKCRVDDREFALYRAAALASDVDEIVVVNARHPEIESATTRLEPVWRAEVERLVPSGTAGAGPDAGSRALVDAWQRHRFFEGLARALIGVGRRTLLVGLVERMPVSPGLTSSIAKGSRSWVRGCGSLPLPPRWRVSRAALRCSNWRWRPSSW